MLITFSKVLLIITFSKVLLIAFSKVAFARHSQKLLHYINSYILKSEYINSYILKSDHINSYILKSDYINSYLLKSCLYSPEPETRNPSTLTLTCQTCWACCMCHMCACLPSFSSTYSSTGTLTCQTCWAQVEGGELAITSNEAFFLEEVYIHMTLSTSSSREWKREGGGREGR